MIILRSRGLDLGRLLPGAGDPFGDALLVHSQGQGLPDTRIIKACRVTLKRTK